MDLLGKELGEGDTRMLVMLLILKENRELLLRLFFFNQDESEELTRAQVSKEN